MSSSTFLRDVWQAVSSTRSATAIHLPKHLKYLYSSIRLSVNNKPLYQSLCINHSRSFLPRKPDWCIDLINIKAEVSKRPTQMQHLIQNTSTFCFFFSFGNPPSSSIFSLMRKNCFTHVSARQASLNMSAHAYCKRCLSGSREITLPTLAQLVEQVPQKL